MSGAVLGAAPTLRNYQKRDIQSIRHAFGTGHQRVLYQAPTGSGKTVVFSFIAHGAKSKGKNVLVLVHRRELVKQASDSLNLYGVAHGVIARGWKEDYSHHVQVASVQTFIRRSNSFTPDLIVIDEAHHAVAGSWLQALARFPKAKLLGVTATPERLDGKGLGSVFSHLILGPAVDDLVQKGFLSAFEVYGSESGLDMEGVGSIGGDFDRKEVKKRLDASKVTGDAVAHYQKHLSGQRAVAFCVGVEHAREVAAAFNLAGIPASVIDGAMKDADREWCVKALTGGAIKLLVSCEIISEGFDLPAVAGCLLLRPTKSLALHLQQVGRCLRPAPGKTHAVILDHVDNWLRHGFPDTEREWSLAGRPKRRGRQSLGYKRCPGCQRICLDSVRTCKCGHKFRFTAAQRKSPEKVDGDLVKIDPAEAGRDFARKQLRREVGMSNSLEALQAIEQRRGYQAGWAQHVWDARLAKHARKLGVA